MVEKPRVAIIGIGNCASVLLQGMDYYKKKNTGLWHEKVGGLSLKDIAIVSAFDVDARKVGLDLSDAIFSEPNVAQKFYPVEKKNIDVKPGILTNEVPPHLSSSKTVCQSGKDFVKELESSGANIVLNLISSGTERTSLEYARLSSIAGCSFINCTPSVLVKKKELVAKYKRSKLVIAGDDLMSQFGGTVFHKALVKLMAKRGVRITKSYQLDVGGGTETYNTIEEKIKMAKRKIKTESVAAEAPYKFETVAGTTDYVDYMGNNRTSYFWLEGSIFLGARVTIDVYLRTSDGANAGNVILDVIRAVHASIKRGEYGAVPEICAYGFKSPPERLSFEDGYEKFEKKFL